MLIQRILNCTRIMGVPKDWDKEALPCNALPIKDVTCDGVPFMVSAWEPTPEELAALNRGETVKLWIQGTVHPVVSLTVGPIQEL